MKLSRAPEVANPFIVFRSVESLAGLTRRAALLGAMTLPAGCTAMFPVRGTKLRAAARSSGRFFGAAVQAEQLRNDSLFRGVVAQQCDSITPELELKWGVIEPAPGRPVFAQMDQIAAFARTYGLRLHGHTLLWHQSVPGWASQSMVEAKDWNIVGRYFAPVMARYSDVIDWWDVVNEPIEATEDGSGDCLRRSVFYEAFGPDYIRSALETARAIAPRAKLLINDYGFEYSGKDEQFRRKGLLALVDALQRRAVPLDGIGLQAHLDLSREPLDQMGLATFLKEIADRGLLIQFTELDVREADRSLPIPLRDQAVAEAARALLDVVLDQPAVRGISTWGLSDRYSWIDVDPDGRRHIGRNRGLPLDVEMQPKPFWHALVEAFSGRPSTGARAAAVIFDQGQET